MNIFAIQRLLSAAFALLIVGTVFVTPKPDATQGEPGLVKVF